MKIWSEGQNGVSYFLNKTQTSGGRNGRVKDRFQLVKAYIPKGPKTKKYISHTSANKIMDCEKKESMALCDEIINE